MSEEFVPNPFDIAKRYAETLGTTIYIMKIYEYDGNEEMVRQYKQQVEQLEKILDKTIRLACENRMKPK